MKARDIFGIIVRTMGLVLFLYSIWNLVFGVAAVFGILGNTWQPGQAIDYIIFGVAALILGILLMLLGRQIVRLCYLDNKDDSDA